MSSAPKTAPERPFRTSGPPEVFARVFGPCEQWRWIDYVQTRRPGWPGALLITGFWHQFVMNCVALPLDDPKLRLLTEHEGEIC